MSMALETTAYPTERTAMATSSSSPSSPFMNGLPQQQDAAAEAAPQADLSAQLRAYAASNNFPEFCFCLVFCIVATCLEWLPTGGPLTTVRQRPIPYQLLENSGDYVRNLVNNEKHVDDTVSINRAFFLALLFPMALQFMIIYVMGKRVGGSFADLHCVLCTYLTTVGITLLVTDAIKLYVGYLRPIFYDVCQPDENYAYCTGENVDEVRKSFPSGHASTSFCGLTLFTLFLHTRFGVPSYRKRRHMVLIDAHQQQQQQPSIANEEMMVRPSPVDDGKVVLVEYAPDESVPGMKWARVYSVASLLPMALAAYIAASRVKDNKHFPADIVTGSVIGASVAVFTFGLWFD